MTENNPTDRSKPGTKRHILTSKKGILLSAVVSSASTHDINLVTEVVDNAVVRIRRGRGRNRRQHLCLDKGYNSEQKEQKLMKRGYVLHIPIKKKKGEDSETKIEAMPNRKKYSHKRWVVERTNSWYNLFRKQFTRYEKKVENSLGLLQFSCCIILYRKIILE